MELNYALISDVIVAGIDTKDAPDFCDAFIESATYNGREMTWEELDVLNNDSDYVYQKTIDQLY